ncbi:hypothetical protein Acr_11g0011580 [Actinidia rufa]|uniref:Uncharacterized protein n=1 Tax=Actinidia rufa TaxID=165716 RepID=A0A7J0FDS5_9ERIC|nr:hypothetical protein Acr_11g0011580 [Actinidia rufa]
MGPKMMKKRNKRNDWLNDEEWWEDDIEYVKDLYLLQEMELNYVEFTWYDPTNPTDDSIWYELQEPQTPIDPTLKEPSNPSTLLIDQNVGAVVQEQEGHNSKVKIKNKPTDLGNSPLEFLLANLDPWLFG